MQIFLSLVLTGPVALSACGGDADTDGYPCGDTFVPACTPSGQQLSCEAGTVKASACPAGSTCGMGLCCPTMPHARVVNNDGACAYACEPGTTNQGTAAQPNCVVRECTVDACHGGQLMRCDPTSHHFGPATDCPQDQLCAKGDAASAGASCVTRDDFVFTTTWAFKDTDVAVFVRDPDPSLPPSRFDLDCDGDGTYERINLHAGLYLCKNPPNTKIKVSLRGYIQRLNFGAHELLGSPSPLTMGIDPDKLTEIQSHLTEINHWGKNPWRSTEGMFQNYFGPAPEMLAADAPNLSQTINVAMMFATFDPEQFGPVWDLRSWDVSDLSSLKNMFHSAGGAILDLRGWDTRNVTDMQGMFAHAAAPVWADWKTPNVKDMSFMFYWTDGPFTKSADASGFAGDDWDVSNVTNMASMFRNAENRFADPKLSGWNVSNVTNMSRMFEDNDFNPDLSGWKVSKVTNMSRMFYKAGNFNADISNWDVSNVTDMSSMFGLAGRFNADISNWVVSNVTNMSRMFEDAKAFNADISNWVVSNVTDMSQMFAYAKAFNADISNWNVSNVTDMSSMFRHATEFNHDLSGWKTGKLTNMGAMFSGAEKFAAKDLSGWDVSSVTNMASLFRGASAFNGDISGWNVSSVTDMDSMFYGAKAFNGNISGWNVSSVTDMDYMFYGAEAFKGDLSGWDVSSVTSHNKFAEGAHNDIKPPEFKK